MIKINIFAARQIRKSPSHPENCWATPGTRQLIRLVCIYLRETETHLCTNTPHSQILGKPNAHWEATSGYLHPWVDYLATQRNAWQTQAITDTDRPWKQPLRVQTRTAKDMDAEAKANRWLWGTWGPRPHKEPSGVDWTWLGWTFTLWTLLICAFYYEQMTAY